jgi:hypothetical protein
VLLKDQQEESMRGSDIRTGDLFSYVDLEHRVPANHPLRLIRRIVNEVLAALDSEFGRLYATEGRPSIAPERLLRALLLQGVLQHPLGAPVDGTIALQSALSLV